MARYQNGSSTPQNTRYKFVEMVGFQQIQICYKKLNKIRMINRSCKFQGCSLIYTAMVTDFDVPVLSMTVGIQKYPQCAYVKNQTINALNEKLRKKKMKNTYNKSSMTSQVMS